MRAFDAVIFWEAIRAGRIEWSRHVVQKLAERGFSHRSVRETLLHGERIRDYVDDRPFPSALFLGHVSGRPLHVVAACDPSLEIFEPDYKTKRNDEHTN